MTNQSFWLSGGHHPPRSEPSLSSLQLIVQMGKLRTGGTYLSGVGGGEQPWGMALFLNRQSSALLAGSVSGSECISSLQAVRVPLG